MRIRSGSKFEIRKARLEQGRCHLHVETVNLGLNGIGQAVLDDIAHNTHDFKFDTIAGRSYRLYYKLHINDPTWLALSAPVQAMGASLTINDNIGPDAQRFYRVFQVD